MQTNGSPSRLAVLLAVAFLVGVGCTSAVHWLFLAPSGERDGQLADAVAPPSPVEIESSTQAPSSPTDASNAPEPPNLTVRSLDEIAGMKTTSEQQLALRTLLSDLGEEQVVDLLTQSQDLFGESDRIDLQFAVFQRLAHQNPSRALTLALEMEFSNNRRSLVTTIYKDWAHSDLDEAVSRAGKLEPHFKRVALRAIVQERTDLSDSTIRAIALDLDNEQIATLAIAQRKIDEAIDDPETAWNELAIDLQDDPASYRTISRVAMAWVEKSGLGVLDQVYQSLTNTETRDEVIDRVLVEVSQADPESAFNYALTLENDPYHLIVSDMAETWAMSDPRAALAAAIGIERASVRNAVSTSVISTWAYSEPREVLDGLDALTPDLQETAFSVAVREIASESPEEGAELVTAMEPGSVKRFGAYSVVSVWFDHDHKAVLDWVLNEPGVEEVKSELLSSIIHRLVKVDLELAMSTALAQPLEKSTSGFGMFGREGVGMEFQIISTLAHSDVDKAIEALGQVRGGLTKLLSYQTVATSLLMEDEFDKAFNMVHQVPESDREKVYQAIASSWAMSDPQGMLKSMDRFPSEEHRSRAAAIMMMTNQFSKSLSDEQIEEAKKHLTDEYAKALEDGDPEALQSLFQAF